MQNLNKFVNVNTIKGRGTVVYLGVDTDYFGNNHGHFEFAVSDKELSSRVEMSRLVYIYSEMARTL